MNIIVRNIALWLSDTAIASLIEIFLGVMLNVWNRIVIEYNLPLKTLDIAYHYGVVNYVDASTSYDPQDIGDGNETLWGDLINLDEGDQEPLVTLISGSEIVKFKNLSTRHSTYSEGDRNHTKRQDVVSERFFDSLENCEVDQIVDSDCDNIAEICNHEVNIHLIATSFPAILPIKDDNTTANLEHGDSDISPSDDTSKYSSDNAKSDLECFSCEGKFFGSAESSAFEIDQTFKEIFTCYNDKFRISECAPTKNFICDSSERKPLMINKNQEDIVRQNQNIVALKSDSDTNLYNTDAKTSSSDKESPTKTIKNNEHERDRYEGISEKSKMVKYLYSPTKGKFLKKKISKEDNTIDNKNISVEKTGMNENYQSTVNHALNDIEREDCRKESEVHSSKTNGAIRKSRGTENYFQSFTRDDDISLQNDSTIEELNFQHKFASAELINTEETTSVKNERHDCVFSLKFNDIQNDSFTKLIEPHDIQKEIAPPSNNYEHTYYMIESYEHIQLNQAPSETIIFPPTHTDTRELKYTGEQSADEDTCSIISIQANVQEFLEASSMSDITRIDRDSKKVHFNTEVETFTYEPDSSIVENFNLEKESVIDDTLMGVINDKSFFMPGESNDFMTQTARTFFEHTGHRPESNFMEEWVQKEQDFQETNLPLTPSDPFIVNSEPEEVIDVSKKDPKSWRTFKDLHKILRKKRSIDRNLSHNKSQVPTRHLSYHTSKVDPKTLVNKLVKKVFRK